MGKHQLRKGLKLRRLLKNRYAKDLRTPKYKSKVVPDKKKKLNKEKCKLKDEEDKDQQYGLDLGTAEVSNVKSFTSKKKLDIVNTNNVNISNEEAIEHGLETFVSELGNNAKGFYAIVFDEHGHPCTIGAGELETAMLVFALEVAKSELLKTVFAENI